MWDGTGWKGTLSLIEEKAALSISGMARQRPGARGGGGASHLQGQEKVISLHCCRIYTAIVSALLSYLVSFAGNPFLHLTLMGILPSLLLVMYLKTH